MISADERYTKKRATILGRTMAYVDEGSGDPILFLHGNPTSSYLWRNIMPHLEGLGRCIAPDLIGMGDSDKLPQSGPASYRFVEHRTYLDGLLDHLGVTQNVVLVVHDWGSALGFDWGNRHRDAVQGYAYMESIVRPLTWAEWPEASKRVFEGFRSPSGEGMAIEKNIFVERVLPGSILREITEAEMAVYRRPYVHANEDRRPTLTWPREIPIEGEPADVAAIVQDYSDWLSTSDVAKLFINADPGALLTGAPREFCRAWPNQEEVTVPGSHFIQEDAPDDIGMAIANFVKRLRG
ncbi:MAG: haloalkane dehalogenase [Candidatus Entotheonella factor]|uniref:Haloalkane dehalogenase n=1 Tax=Entotheonella factor TaxID=1429438 RepID=W4LKQ9_ENTF1|nr:MAG: haloalkane dehalogenase [Candidatus Entotheonella factor]